MGLPCIFALLPPLLLLGGSDLAAAGRGGWPEFPSQQPEIFVTPHAPKDFLPIVWRDRDGQIVRIDRGGVTQTFGRGAGGRIASAASNVSGAPSFAYPSHDGQGRRTAANTNRGNWTYSYRGGVNGDGQLNEASHTGNWDFAYEHDGIGRRLSASSPASGGNPLATGNAEDALNRFLSTEWEQNMLVLRASLDREADVEITESFALPTIMPGLDPDEEEPPLRDIVHALTPPGAAGGWTAWSITGTLEGGGDPGAAPDRKAKLAGLTWFPPAEESFTYDAAGNRSSSARWNYTYDGLNRLTRAINKDLTTAPEAWDVQFTYDAEGRRHSKTSRIYRNGGLKDSTITTWIWDGWHPVIERIIDPKTGKTITERKLVWGPDISGQIGEAGGAGGLLLIRETNDPMDGRPPVTEDLLPLYDGSGNIVGLANPAGELLAEYWYGPFGELIESSGLKADSNPWRWASKSLDPETGLVYFGLRYYDPATGQWLSREPLGEGESLNLYAYAHNDPINRVDVLGAEEAWHAKMQRAMMDQNYAMDHNGLNRSGNPVGDIYIRMGEADRLTSAQRVFGNVAGALIERDPSEVALSPGAPLGRGLAHNLQLLGDTWAMEFLEMKTLAEAPGRFLRDEAVPEHMVAGREAYLKAYTIGERDTASTTLLAGSLFGPSLAAKGSRFTAGLFEQTASSLSRLSVPTIRTVPGEVFCLTPRIKIGFGPPVAKAPQGLKWVRDMQKGRRPHPAAYLSVGERKAIESAFDQGAVRFTSYSNIKKFGTAGSGDAFVFPKSHFDRVIAEAGGNLRLIERRLGLPAGYLGDTDTVAAFIERNDFSRLRIATGNEHGADLDFWIPGGTTSGGVPEVILDLSQTPFTIVPFR